MTGSQQNRTQFLTSKALRNVYITSRWMAALSLCCIYSAIAAPANDTARLLKNRHAVRNRQLSPDDYQRLRMDYVAWIDRRVKAGESLTDMNRELKAAGLVAEQPNALSGDKNLAGYVDPIKIRQVPSTKAVFVLEASMYQGTGCSSDVTAIVYERTSLAKLAEINATPGSVEFPYYLSGIDVSDKDATGGRLIASGWTVSNPACTSTWNGKLIRIDQANDSWVKNILRRDLWAHDRDPENITVRVKGSDVTFEYDGGTPDVRLFVSPSIARYRIVDNQAVRESPIALTRSGFINEWLNMTDSEAKGWGKPQAIEKRTARCGRHQRTSL